ncbi:MAG TPA: molybdopterin-dependent oxidoreductase [Longimicrobiales bacterium]|nr:molybdopterin-dependent oxidoreductase [Longimicrobiales bacterium]
MTEGIKRRDFLKVLGVGGAGVGMAGCSTGEVEKLLPYVIPPEDITPGVSTWYTTVCQECAAQCGMWVRTREGRAVKVEGNPNHAVSGGALCARGHSSIQGLYNPDRIAAPLVREGEDYRQISWEEAETLLAQRLQGAAGNVLFLSGRMGPTETDLVTRFLSVVGGEHVQYDGLSDPPLQEATRIAFGRDVIPQYDFERAEMIVSFGADFLETWISPVEYGRGFARAAGVAGDSPKARVVWVGPRLSLTGQNADEWLPTPAGSEAAVALGMASAIARRGADAGPYASILDEYTPETAAQVSGLEADQIREMALAFADAPSVAVGPGQAGHHQGATAANLAVHILNAVAGNVGRTVQLDAPVLSAAARPYQAVAQAAAGISGQSVVMVRGINPVYSLPAATGFADAFVGAGFKVAFATEPDETTALADLVLPDRHFLESWGDSNPRPGVYAVQQPVMQPVPHFDTRAAGDVLLAVATRIGSPLGPESTYAHLQARWQELHGRSGSALGFEAWWKTALKSGAVMVGAPTAQQAAPLRNPDTALTFEAPTLDGDGEFTLLVYPSARFGDGRHANRPWMQELPDPVSKLAWHSWVEMHPESAERLGLRRGDVVTVRSPQGEVTLPLYTYPGIRTDAVAIAMGGGRTDSGRYANGKGVNPMNLLPAVAEQPSGALVLVATRVSVEATGDRHRMASIEGADTQHDRNIAPAVALAELGHAAEEAGQEEGGYEEHGLAEMNLLGGFQPVETEGAAEDFPLPGSRYGDYGREGTPRWTMAIDLDKCTGCSACIVACQSENNVAFVGEEQVAMGRDLAWIRLERYYEHVDASHASHLDIRHLPMLCQHCGNAPCEPVCPVFAAYHTPDGLNAQVYNRCVGTRYCANNCPYKVRVYNWYTYADVPEPLHWQYNPDVTIRNTGVMEKCSFCVQRIREVQNRAALEGGRSVADGEVVPACQQSCPAEAIVFGNIHDEESRVAQLVHDERTYRVLDELINTQPGVHYLKKVTFHEVESGAH